MNKVFIIGNLTRDPEVRTSSTGNAYVTFGVAVNIRGNSAQQETTNFYSVRMFRQLDAMQRFLTKGKKVAVVGSLSLRIYEGNDGQKRIAADVMADDIEFLSPPNQGDGQGGYGGGQNNSNYAPRPAEPFGQVNAPVSEAGFSQVEDDDLPF